MAALAHGFGGVTPGMKNGGIPDILLKVLRAFALQNQDAMIRVLLMFHLKATHGLSLSSWFQVVCLFSFIYETASDFYMHEHR